MLDCFTLFACDVDLHTSAQNDAPKDIAERKSSSPSPWYQFVRRILEAADLIDDRKSDALLLPTAARTADSKDVH